jgi:hypothetical protein
MNFRTLLQPLLSQSFFLKHSSCHRTAQGSAMRCSHISSISVVRRRLMLRFTKSSGWFRAIVECPAAGVRYMGTHCCARHFRVSLANSLQNTEMLFLH